MSPKHSAVIVLVLAVLFAGGTTFPLQGVAETREALPEFDPDNPLAIGIILVFHRRPDEDERRIILEKTKEAGLTKTGEIARFKMWLFQWGEWQKGETAEEFCRSLPELSSLEYCEPDSLLGPATGSVRSFLSPPL